MIGSAALLMTACEVTVSRADLEKKVAEHISRATGETVDQVDCPGDLHVEQGLKLECAVTTSDERMTVTVTVTEIDGANVRYEIEEKAPS